MNEHGKASAAARPESRRGSKCHFAGEASLRWMGASRVPLLCPSHPGLWAYRHWWREDWAQGQQGELRPKHPTTPSLHLPAQGCQSPTTFLSLVYRPLPALNELQCLCYVYEIKLKVNKSRIKQDHQVFVTRNKENKSSIPLCFCIYLGAKYAQNGILLPPCAATYLCLKDYKEQRCEMSEYNLRLLLGWAREHENLKHHSSLQM